MAITASMIKELRERTGAGIMDCKKVLTETNGDIDSAIEELRKKGSAAAEKKAGRIAAEGVIVSARSDEAGVLVEVNCETDFVVKNESFMAFANNVANAILAGSPADISSVSDLRLGEDDNGDSSTGDDSTVETTRQELIAKIGENISVRRFTLLNSDGGSVSTYLHGARIGVMVKLSGGDDQLGRDLAMHIAATNPLCIAEQDMSKQVLAKEKEIFLAQAQDSGKPAEIAEKMVVGRMKKFLRENTLLGQQFVKNPDQSVAELVAAAGATVEQMVRFEVGEGLEKRSDDFVAEVMAQAGG